MFTAYLKAPHLFAQMYVLHELAAASHSYASILASAARLYVAKSVAG